MFPGQPAPDKTLRAIVLWEYVYYFTLLPDDGPNHTRDHVCSCQDRCRRWSRYTGRLNGRQGLRSHRQFRPSVKATEKTATTELHVLPAKRDTKGEGTWTRFGEGRGIGALGKRPWERGRGTRSSLDDLLKDFKQNGRPLSALVQLLRSWCASASRRCWWKPLNRKRKTKLYFNGNKLMVENRRKSSFEVYWYFFGGDPCSCCFFYIVIILIILGTELNAWIYLIGFRRFDLS